MINSLYQYSRISAFPKSANIPRRLGKALAQALKDTDVGPIHTYDDLLAALQLHRDPEAARALVMRLEGLLNPQVAKNIQRASSESIIGRKLADPAPQIWKQNPPWV